MNPVEQMRADWNRRAGEDAFYYVAFVRPGQSRDEFLASAAAIAGILESELVRLPPAGPQTRRALEVGCGPGRLMLAMRRHFGEIHGVDISDEMIRLGRELLRDVPNLHFHLTPDSDLRMFADGWFDYAYSYVVFQHIPSQAVVLNYLREMARVLKPGGIMCCQLQGAPPPPARKGEEASTWSGCYFTWPEIRGFVEKNGLHLAAISGVDTQYMMVTLRKPDAAGERSVTGPAVLKAVTPASGAGPGVPRKGPGAAVSLWMEGLPRDANLLDFEIRIGGDPAFPCYISPPMGDSGYQINALLPRNLAAGQAGVEVRFRGEPMPQAFEIEVAEALDLAPEIVSISDGLDLASPAVYSASMKVAIRNVASPESVRFSLDQQPAAQVEFVCLDPIASQYQFSFAVPRGVRPGEQVLRVIAGETELPPASVEIRDSGLKTRK